MIWWISQITWYCSKACESDSPHTTKTKIWRHWFPGTSVSCCNICISVSIVKLFNDFGLFAWNVMRCWMSNLSYICVWLVCMFPWPCSRENNMIHTHRYIVEHRCCCFLIEGWLHSTETTSPCYSKVKNHVEIHKRRLCSGSEWFTVYASIHPSISPFVCPSLKCILNAVAVVLRFVFCSHFVARDDASENYVNIQLPHLFYMQMAF